MVHKKAFFRFYEELNDFLPREKKKSFFPYSFKGNTSVKNAVESIGVPHTEIDLILVNSKSVEFSYRLKDRDKVSVYPVFETLDISNVTHLRKKSLREPKYTLNGYLGKLASYLCMLGFDARYKDSYNDSEIIRIAKVERRIILTRNPEILRNKDVSRGYWIRSKSPEEQLNEVIDYFDLYSKIDPLLPPNLPLMKKLTQASFISHS